MVVFVLHYLILCDSLFSILLQLLGSNGGPYLFCNLSRSFLQSVCQVMEYCGYIVLYLFTFWVNGGSYAF